MGWRTVFVDNANKLSLSLDNLIVIHKNEKYSISLTEIESVIVTDYKCVITSRLLARCCELGINFIFTKQNKMPVGALHCLENNTRSSKMFKEQLFMTKELRQQIWQNIIEIKLHNQVCVLKKYNKQYEIVEKYSKEVEIGDITNKEGQAARVYFKKLFGYYFTRDDEDIMNYSLNYAYQVVRSRIAQVLLAKGLNPSVGVFHRNEYNYFNLSDDMIEVFRPIVDDYIINLVSSYEYSYLTPNLKISIANVVNTNVLVNDKKYKLSNAIDEYLNDIVKIICLKQEKIKKVPRLYEE